MNKQGMSEALLTCESPVCDARFEQTGMVRMEPRRFCNDQCRMDAWILKRAKSCWTGLPMMRPRILRGVK